MVAGVRLQCKLACPTGGSLLLATVLNGLTCAYNVLNMGSYCLSYFSRYVRVLLHYTLSGFKEEICYFGTGTGREVAQWAVHCLACPIQNNFILLGLYQLIFLQVALRPKHRKSPSM